MTNTFVLAHADTNALAPASVTVVGVCARERKANVSGSGPTVRLNARWKLHWVQPPLEPGRCEYGNRAREQGGGSCWGGPPFAAAHASTALSQTCPAQVEAHVPGIADWAEGQKPFEIISVTPHIYCGSRTK